MRRHWKIAVVILSALVLLASPLLACGSKQTSGTVTVRVGYLTDLSGPASTAMLPNGMAIEDAWEYLEKNDPIPGVKLKLDAYDTQMDPSRAIPAYEWFKQRGVVVMYAYMPQTLEVLLPFLAQDKMPAFTHGVTEAEAACPWVFDSGPTDSDIYTASLKYVSDTWTKYPTKPKVGLVGWNTPYEIEIEAAMKAYALAHPDKFDWVGSYLVPAGTMTWGGEIGRLKDCDYICPCQAAGTGVATFIEQFRSQGYAAKFFGGAAMPCWTSLIIPKVGWTGMEGSVTFLPWPWWSDQVEGAAVARDALARNHSGQTQDSLGYAYVSQVTAQFFWYKLLKAAVEEVGAENLTGQAVYDAATKFSCTLDGMMPMGYTQTDRVNTHYTKGYKWSAQASDLVPVTDWILAPE
ncbi:MAG: ABC transporter substrate-binding protein [Chloroflexi bacterium]|nr:ABC transporter substrate-binding protein [Chloroflexota bacterium]